MKHSKLDSRGKLWVACSECERGGNGDESCSSGWRIKRGGKNGCFLGTLLPKHNHDLAKQVQEDMEWRLRQEG